MQENPCKRRDIKRFGIHVNQKWPRFGLEMPNSDVSARTGLRRSSRTGAVASARTFAKDRDDGRIHLVLKRNSVCCRAPETAEFGVVGPVPGRIRTPGPMPIAGRSRLRPARLQRTEPPARMPPSPTSRFLETRDRVRLHVLAFRGDRAGAREAPPVVLLHGGGANAHWWDHLAPALAARRPVYALDFRGHGDSAFPAERRSGAFDDDLDELVAWLGREDVILVGHSLGAAVALDRASRCPATRALVLIDLARGGLPTTGRRARLALTLRRTYRSRAEAAMRFRFLPESSHASEALRAHIGEHSVREEPDGRFGYKFDPAWFALPPRARPDLAQVRCPTLLVRGRESTLLGDEAARAFVESLPDGRLVEIADAGHHVLVDQPERLLAALDDFLHGLPAETAAAGAEPFDN